MALVALLGGCGDGGNAGECADGCPPGAVCIDNRCIVDAGNACASNADCPAGQVCAHGPGDLSACVPGVTLADCTANVREACDIAEERLGGTPRFCVGGLFVDCGATGVMCMDCGDEASCDIDDGCARRDAGPDAGSCPDGMLRCDDGDCHDTDTDPAHCGACGLACSGDHVCSGGTCGCETGLTDCGADGCHDTESENEHCGACGNACAAGEVCSSGTCQADCDVGLTDCGGDCVDTETDHDNCGACGDACSGTEVCTAGACASSCAGTTVDCGGRCVDTEADEANCGACGNACASMETCSAGDCVLECGSGLLMCAGMCSDVLSDPSNCGACGTTCMTGELCVMGTCDTPCAPGETDCMGVCRDLDTDPTSCGACGTTCRADEVCAAGACGCATGQTQCAGACEDLTSDPENCGACGNDCAAGQVCSMGTCTTSCDMGFTNCGGACVNTGTSMAHCGGCGMTCGPFANAMARCNAGTCDMTCNMGYSNCDGSRTNGCEVLHLFDLNNCGACGVACRFANASAICNHVCGMGPCNPGYADCDGLAATGCECRVVTVGPPGSPPFSSGTLTDLDVDPVGGAITPTGMVTTTERDYLWVVNVNESSVSKWDASTQMEVARYRVGLASGECVGTCCHANGCNMPSRVVVDGNGDAYSAQRGFQMQGTVTKIAGDLGDCIDRNGNGMIDTSSGATALPYGADECVLWTSNIGAVDAVLRGIAVDRGDAARPNGYLWVGTYNTGTVYRVDPSNGAILNTITGIIGSYGMIVTSDDRLWVTELSGRLQPIDTTTFAVGSIIDVGFSKYGIAADANGRLWFTECCFSGISSWGTRVLGYDPATGMTSIATLPRGRTSSGVTVDAMANVWVAFTEGTTRTGFVRFPISAFNPGGAVAPAALTYYDGPANPTAVQPTAVGVDRSGAVWHGSYFGNSRLLRLDPTLTTITEYTGPNMTYSYSDFTGSVRRASIPQGSYEQTFDLGCNNPVLGNFTIAGTFPADTLTTVTMRTAATTAGLAGATPVSVAALPPNGSPYALGPIFSGAGVTPRQQVEVELVLREASSGAAPIVASITFNWTCP